MYRSVLFSVAVIMLSITAQAQSISIKGSDTLGDKMVPELIKAYKATGSAAEFAVEAEGSSSAFKALLSGSAEIGMSSRPIKDEEKSTLSKAGLEIEEHVAAIDMIAVIVNKANTVDNVGLSAIEKIFTSAVATWKTANNAPVMAYTRNESSGTFKVFQKLGMNGQDYGAKTVKLDGNGQIAEKVAAEVGGVGYVGLSYADATGVKALKIEGVSPNPTNAETYPLSRKLYYYTVKGKLSAQGAAFLKWAMSDPAAGKVITTVGFIPAK